MTTMTMRSPSKTADNGVNVAALLGAREALSKAPAAAAFKWRVACEWINGTHSRSAIGTFFGLGADQSRKTTFSVEADHPEVFAAEDQAPTPVEIDRAITELRATGVKVMITELDVNLLPPAAPATPGEPPPAAANPYANGLPDDLQQALARYYADAFRVFLTHRDDITRVTFWGVSDADSWLNRGRANYPLLWNRQREPKPAFDEVVKVLRTSRP